MKTVAERLKRSTGGVHVDPVPDLSPNKRLGDGVVTFFDHHGVVEDCKGNDSQMRAIKNWLEEQIAARLPDLIKKLPELDGRIKKRFTNDKNPRGIYLPDKLKIYVFDEYLIKGIYCKFWFKILRV